MTRRKLPQTWSTSTRIEGYVQAEPRWHGTGLITGPASDGLGWTEERVQCEHEHTSIDAARECGARLARQAAKAKAALAEAAYLATPCRIEIVADPVFGGDQYIKVCKAHRTSAGRLYPEREQAEAYAWTCPWAKFVKEAN